jgi:hypothetical protein
MMSRGFLTSPVGLSVGAIALAGVALAWQLPPLLSAVIVGGPDPAAEESAIDQYVARNDETIQRYTDRFIGRSMFFPPKPPPPKIPPPPPEPVVVEEVDPGPPPPPATYEGPLHPKAILGEEVWFDKDSGEVVRLEVGDESDGVTLIEVNGPWHLRVAHGGAEYDIDLFDDRFRRSDDLFANAKLNGDSQFPALFDPNAVPVEPVIPERVERDERDDRGDRGARGGRGVRGEAGGRASRSRTYPRVGK